MKFKAWSEPFAREEREFWERCVLATMRRSIRLKRGVDRVALAIGQADRALKGWRERFDQEAA